MSASACGGGGGGSRSASLPGTDIPTNPGLPGNPGNPGNPETRGNPDPGGPTTPTTTPGALQTTLGNTGKAVDNVLPLNLGTTLASARRSIPRSSP